MTFGQHLRSMRDRLGITQTQLGIDAGMDPASINHYESGRRQPSLANIVRLADALKITTDELLGRGQVPNEDIQRATLRASFERYLDAVVTPVRAENAALRKALNERMAT